jgi:hypothetical protein
VYYHLAIINEGSTSSGWIDIFIYPSTLMGVQCRSNETRRGQARDHASSYVIGNFHFKAPSPRNREVSTQQDYQDVFSTT